VIPAEGLQDQAQDAENRLAPMLRFGEVAPDVVVQTFPRLVEDRLQQPALPAEIADQLRLGGPRLAGNGRSRRLLVPKATEECLAGREKSGRERFSRTGASREVTDALAWGQEIRTFAFRHTG
jgi:hypothetical protein